MALHPHQVQTDGFIRHYSGVPRIYGSFRIAVDGKLTLLRYDSDTTCLYGCKFDVKINGTSIYADEDDWVLLDNGDNEVESAALNITVAKGDFVELLGKAVTSFGQAGGKLYTNFYVEDGLPTYLGGTSSTSNTIGTGSKTFTVPAGLGYSVGSRVRVARTSAPTTTYIEGVVTAYSGTSLTLTADIAVGTGTHTDWSLNVAGERGATGATGSTGADGPPGDDGADGVGVPAGGTTGQVLAKNSGTNYDTQWSTISGGAGLYSPDKPYPSPSAEDDEFPGPTLDGKWTIENVTPTTNFNIPNHIGFAGATAAQISGIVQAVSNVDQTFRVKIVPPHDVSAGNLTMGFLLKHASGYRELGYLTGQQKCYTWTWTSVSVNSAFLDLLAMFSSIRSVQSFYLECRYVASGTTYELLFSLDGVHFVQICSPTSMGGALTHIGLSMRGGSGLTGYYDWFRKLQGTYTGGNA